MKEALDYYKATIATYTAAQLSNEIQNLERLSIENRIICGRAIANELDRRNAELGLVEGGNYK